MRKPTSSTMLARVRLAVASHTSAGWVQRIALSPMGELIRTFGETGTTGIV